MDYISRRVFEECRDTKNYKPQEFVENVVYPEHDCLENQSLENIIQEVIDSNNFDSDKHFTFKQLTPSNIWLINHNLNKFVSITVVDSGGNTIIGDFVYIDENNVQLNFTSSFSGDAYLN